MAIWRMRVSCWTSKDTRAQAHTSTHPHTDTAVCNTYCISTTTVVTLTHIDVHCCLVNFIVDCNLFLIDAIKACIGRRGISPLMLKSWEEYRYLFSGRLVGFRACVDDLENKIFFSCRESNPLYIIAQAKLKIMRCLWKGGDTKRYLYERETKILMRGEPLIVSH